MTPERRKGIQAAKRERMKELVEKLRASFVGITSLMHRFTIFIGFGGLEIDRLVANCTVELGLGGLRHNDTSEVF